MKCNCGETIHPKRVALNYKVCLECGEANAREVINWRKKSVMPMHRSNYVYIDPGNAKQRVKDLSNKNGNIGG